MDLKEELHPVFGESTECIPGLDICQPLEIQFASYSQKFEKENYLKAMNTGKQRYIKEFQIVNLLKDNWPTQMYSGYDIKQKEPVTLLQYKKISVNDVSDLIKETEILRSSTHKHILEFYGTVYGTDVGILYLSFEPFNCFLSQLLCEDHQQLLDEPVIKCIMSQLYTGLAYLHENNIVHRDLSANNIVITEKGLLKIANFRNARRIGQRYEKPLSLEYRYQPVDVLLLSQTISTAIDIWSATCIFGGLILKRTLFKSAFPVGVLSEIFYLLGRPHIEVWPEFIELPDFANLAENSITWYNQVNIYFEGDKSIPLLRKGFYYDPNYRISAEQCLQDPYFINEPKACSSKSFGMKLHEITFKFPVTQSLEFIYKSLEL